MIKAVAGGEIRAKSKDEAPRTRRPKPDADDEPSEPPVYDIGR
jgi:hypothetical protein